MPRAADAPRRLAALTLAALTLAGGPLAGGAAHAVGPRGLRRPRSLDFLRPRPAAPPTMIGRWVSEGDRGTWDVTVTSAGEALAYESLERVGQAGGAREHGVALLRGEHLFVAIAPGWGGLTVYRFAPDGSARGEWTDRASVRDEDDRLLLGAVELDPPTGGALVLGAHRWRSQAGGAAGPLTEARYPAAITALGAALHFEWAPTMEGVGVQRGPWVAATWGVNLRRVSLVDYDASTKDVRGVRVTLGEATVQRDRLTRAP